MYCMHYYGTFPLTKYMYTTFPLLKFRVSNGDIMPHWAQSKRKVKLQCEDLLIMYYHKK